MVSSNLFFWGVEGFPVVSTRPGSANGYRQRPGTNGNVTDVCMGLGLSDTVNTNLTVYYSMSGTAINGVDYANIGNSITFPSNSVMVECVTIQPYPSDVLEFVQTITLTLVLTNGYLVDPQNDSLTFTLCDGNLTVLPDSISAPVGMEYNPF